MILSVKDYRNKTLGCWLGKCIGGTLGAPTEWKRQKNNISFYQQELKGETLPNDDLDLQLLWLVALEERGIDLDSHILADYWVLYNDAHWSEYGNSKVNLKAGLYPPLSGSMHNDYKDSCGSFIRSEIWSTISPGNPEVASRYAYNDASIDHGNGEGIYAEIFVAAMESSAYIVEDINKLIEIGLSYIPEDCGVAKAVKCVLVSYNSGIKWGEARIEILKNFRAEVYWGIQENISPEDIQLGLDGGKQGWDAPANIGFIIIGLLYGERDFEKSICIAANCGEDTDCTCATVGSLFGIIYGKDAIPEKWIVPIGNKIKTLCLNLADMVAGGLVVPGTVEELTDRTLLIARQVLLRNHSLLQLSDIKETDLIYNILSWEAARNFIHVKYVDTSLDGKRFYPDLLKSKDHGKKLYTCLTGPVFKNHQYEIAVDYLEEGSAIYGEEKKIKIKITNHSNNFQEFVNLHWYIPEEWTITPTVDAKVFMTTPFLNKHYAEIDFTFNIPNPKSVNRSVLEITMDGRSFVQLIPVIFTKEIS